MQPQQPQYGQTPASPVPPQPAPATPSPSLPGPVQQYAVPGAPSPTQAYDFILNPAQPAPRNPLAPSGLLQRVVLIGAGVAILMIVAVIGSKLLAGKNSSVAAMTPVLQYQTAIMHLTDSTTISHTGGASMLSDAHRNFIATASLALNTSTQQDLQYVAINHGKIKPLVLSALVSAKTDQELTLAAQAGTFDTTYQDVMQTELQNYKTALQRSYKELKGPKGRHLLDDQFKQADLLLNALQKS